MRTDKGYVAGLFTQTIQDRCGEAQRRLQLLQNSLFSLTNQTSQYAEDHRALIALEKQALRVWETA